MSSFHFSILYFLVKFSFNCEIKISLRNALQSFKRLSTTLFYYTEMQTRLPAKCTILYYIFLSDGSDQSGDLPLTNHFYSLDPTLSIFSRPHHLSCEKEEERVSTSCWRIRVAAALLSLHLHIKGAFIFGLITILTLFKDTPSNPISISQLLVGEHYDSHLTPPIPFLVKPLLFHHHLFSQSIQHLLVMDWAPLTSPTLPTLW